MEEQVTVGALAAEFGLPPGHVIAELRAIGEDVTSASSTIGPPAERALREVLRPPVRRPPRTEESGAVQEWLRASLDPFHPSWVSPSEPVRGPYVGEEVSGLTRLILDHHVLRRLSFGRRPHRHRYWASEVEEARSIARSWSHAVDDGMAEDDVLRWITTLSASSYEHAAALFAEGIEPDELEGAGADHGRPSMATRLTVGNMTVDQVVDEVRTRRAAG